MIKIWVPKNLGIGTFLVGLGIGKFPVDEDFDENLVGFPLPRMSDIFPEKDEQRFGAFSQFQKVA